MKHNYRHLIIDVTREAAETWFNMQMKNNFARLYAYYRKPEGKESICKIAIAEDSPGSEWELIINERLGIGWTKEVCAYKLNEGLRKLSVLNKDLEYQF